MGETVTGGDAGSKGTAVARPTIIVPPRGFMDTIGSLPGFSPGPMTLVSGFFSEQSPFSFSQLLAGAMASPIAKPGLFSTDNNFGEEKEGNSGDGGGGGKNNDSITGYKRNRPMNLAVAPQQMQLDPQNLSPLFMVPPGLSPSGLLNSPGFLSPLQSPFGMSHQQALAHVTAQAALSQSYMQMQVEFQRSSNATSAETTSHHMSSAPNESSQSHIISLPTEQTSSKIEQSEVSLSERKPASVAVNKPTNDGYNWRKYGQKQVKASECPRSYYKCTHFNCPVKKKVERSVDGHITEITYKGHHNHDLPQPSKRGRDNCALDGTSNSQVKPVISSQSQSEMSPENVLYQPGPSKVHVSTQSVSDHRPGSINLDEVEDSTIVNNDGDDDEPNTKRRSIEIGSSMQAPSHKTITESRIVLQTRSEVDLLDDGYKWRKYGQKVVKGNPHPRSYYKCTHAGCNVRKHVERSSTDSKSVITTYEGKHNHEIPTGRYSRPQKLVANNPSLHKEMDYENKDQIAMTLQLKEEQIAA